ncbi:retroviral-like aspartic protease family protein [Myxococcota bacterium]|nr:retroviral-like aspartic protease family protein [Myxococcota bacterium]
MRGTPRSRLERMMIAVSWTLSACATVTEPPKGPALRPPDAIELFRRARFEELAVDGADKVTVLAAALDVRGKGPEQLDELEARLAYRRGDGRAARTALARLPAEHRTRRMLESLLGHVDVAKPLRASKAPEGTLSLPLDPIALDRGHPIVEATIAGRRVELLWDTGSSENILSPRAAEALELPWTRESVTLRRRDDALVARFGTTGTAVVALGAWSVENVPWLVSELEMVENLRRDLDGVDGFLSPQLLLPNGCFAIEKTAAVLHVGFDPDTCAEMMDGARLRTPLFGWNGEVFAVARVQDSPGLAVQLETGSAVSFLRTHAARWLPPGAIMADQEERDGEIAHELRRSVTLRLADRAQRVSAIELEPNRDARIHDDIATLGNDVLLQGRGVVVSFATRELGTLDANRSGTVANRVP